MGVMILDIYDSDEYFVVTTENILEPLGVKVLRDTRYDLLPPIKDISETIPGMHGDIDFGFTFEPRLIEIHVATPNSLTTQSKLSLRRTLAKYLNPSAGYKKLLFMDDPSVFYEVKFASKIGFEYQPSWFEFVIPFKTKPFVLSMVEHELVGSGNILNEGTFECPLDIVIEGPSTNPSVTIGTSVVSYTGSLIEGESIIIKLGKTLGCQTAYIGVDNALADITGDLDITLEPQTTISVVATEPTTSIKWRDTYL